jgi:hypothetical protein
MVPGTLLAVLRHHPSQDGRRAEPEEHHEVALPGHSEPILAMTSVNGLAPLKSSFVSPVIFVQRRLMSR